MLLISNPFGNCNSIKLVQPLNIPWPYPLLPQVQALFANTTEVSEVQPWKAKLPIDDIAEELKVIDVIADPLKALFPTVVTDDGKLTPVEDNEPAPANAEAEIVVKLVNLANSKLDKLEQFANADSPIFVIGLAAPLTVTVAKEVQPLNVSLPKVVVILVGSEMLVILVQSANVLAPSILIKHGEAGQVILRPSTAVPAKAFALRINVSVTLLKSRVARLLQDWKAASPMVKLETTGAINLVIVVLALIASLPIDLYPVLVKSMTPEVEPSGLFVTKSTAVASENKPLGIVPSVSFGNLTVARFSQPFKAY